MGCWTRDVDVRWDMRVSSYQGTCHAAGRSNVAAAFFRHVRIFESGQAEQPNTSRAAKKPSLARARAQARCTMLFAERTLGFVGQSRRKSRRKISANFTGAVLDGRCLGFGAQCWE